MGITKIFYRSLWNLALYNIKLYVRYKIILKQSATVHRGALHAGSKQMGMLDLMQAQLYTSLEMEH